LDFLSVVGFSDVISLLREHGGLQGVGFEQAFV
jgi:hypothetical protein